MNTIRNSAYILNLRRDTLWFMRYGSTPMMVSINWFWLRASADAGISLFHINSVGTYSYIRFRNSWIPGSSEHTAWGCDV